MANISSNGPSLSRLTSTLAGQLPGGGAAAPATEADKSHFGSDRQGTGPLSEHLAQALNVLAGSSSGDVLEHVNLTDVPVTQVATDSGKNTTSDGGGFSATSSSGGGRPRGHG